MSLELALVLWAMVATIVVSVIGFGASSKPWSRRLTMEIGGLLLGVGALIYLMISLVKWIFLL